ncbi:TetR/AcrR family transcriptional regulator [Alkalimarinus alittae]|uniref:TetR/AcrR family transcriptional regulator n=1 Tax=Alkalimarinus alittae TaxID=2961619 RepID=A0ABY6MZN6_9ALTE|nr:TetR/AcrR family transcriptional regulator [Alkalimarinus alittae]UZE95303.1 TetR/AcrR family transcriptional regulator [Alkalimarinus alittae]
MESQTRKEREFARREQEILLAALSLFDNPSWEQVTVDQIAKKADIGKGTVYKHFSTKDEIYARIALDFHDRLLAEFRAINHEQPVEQLMRAVIRQSFTLYLACQAHARVSFYCKRSDYIERLSRSYQERFECMEKQFEAFIGRILDIGIEQGVIPRRPYEQLIMGLEATFDGAMSMIWNTDISSQSKIDQDEFVTFISEYMIAGLTGLSAGAR